MKYLAILKDSLRETLDSKVLYFMIGLSVLVILAVASMSFQPEPAEEGLRSILRNFAGGRAIPGLPQPTVQYEIEDFEQTNDASKPWEAEYRFQLKVTDQEMAFRALVWMSSLKLNEANLSQQDQEAQKRFIKLMQEAQNVPPDQLERIQRDFAKEIERVASPDRMEDFIKSQLSAHGSLEATSVKLQSAAASPIRFNVQARAKPGTYLTWPHKLTFFFGSVPTDNQTALGPLVYSIESTIVGSIGAGITMLISTVITAFFIPNMLRKGTIDLLLSKPIHRSVLLIYKFIGGLAFMFLNTLVIVLGIWLVLGWRSGLWSTGFLLALFILTFEFAIFYSVATLFGVLTRSPIIAILTACLTWAVLFAIGWGYLLIEATRQFETFPAWVYTSSDSAHFILPRYKDLDLLTNMLLAKDLLGEDYPERKMMEKTYSTISWGQSIGFTTGFIVLMLGLACWRFAVKDY